MKSHYLCSKPLFYFRVVYSLQSFKHAFGYCPHSFCPDILPSTSKKTSQKTNSYLKFSHSSWLLNSYGAVYRPEPASSTIAEFEVFDLLPLSHLPTPSSTVLFNRILYFYDLLAKRIVFTCPARSFFLSKTCPLELDSSPCCSKIFQTPGELASSHDGFGFSSGPASSVKDKETVTEKRVQDYFVSQGVFRSKKVFCLCAVTHGWRSTRIYKFSVKLFAKAREGLVLTVEKRKKRVWVELVHGMDLEMEEDALVSVKVLNGFVSFSKTVEGQFMYEYTNVSSEEEFFQNVFFGESVRVSQKEYEGWVGLMRDSVLVVDNEKDLEVIFIGVWKKRGTAKNNESEEFMKKSLEYIYKTLF